MRGRGSVPPMFTGLVQDIGRVLALSQTQGDLRVEIDTALDLRAMPMGASVCCAGCCLSVVEKKGSVFAVDISAESLSRTTLKNWAVGAPVNLEPSLRMGDELGGHFVFGHVDAVVEVLSITPIGGSHKIDIALPKPLRHLVAEKGSVSIDGVSLTVNSVAGDSFSVNIIPHTWAKTTLGTLQQGSKVNFEADMLARYVARAREVLV